MAFTELYIDQSGGQFNGGSSPGAPKLTLTTCVTAALIGGHEYSLTNTAATGWGTTAVGDFLTYGSGFVWCRVLELSYGANPQVIRAEPANESVGMADTNKTATVGGAWNKLTSSEASLAQATATTWAHMGLTTVPPRLNIKKEASAYAETGTFDAYGTWSALIPLRIEGYETVVGDIDWTRDEKWADLNWGTSACHGITVGSYTYIYNIIFRNASTTSWYPINTTAGASRMCNCKGQRTAGGGYYVTGLMAGTHIRCTFETNQDPTAHVAQGGTCGRFFGCVFQTTGTVSAGASGSLLNLSGSYCVVDGCVFYNGWNGCVAIANSTVKNNAFYKLRNMGLNVGVDATVVTLAVTNNIFVDMVYALSTASTTGPVEMLVCENNAYYLCSSGFYTTSYLRINNSSNIALTSDPFVYASGGNFTLKDNTLARAGMNYLLPGTLNYPNISVGALNYYDLPEIYNVVNTDTVDGVPGTLVLTAPAAPANSPFDSAVVAAAETYMLVFGREMVYLPAAGGTRTIKGISHPQGIGRIPGQNFGTTSNFLIQVRNSPTLGIAITELNTGGDKLRFENPLGGSTQDRRINGIEKSDAGMLFLQIA
jgi:hypothetical protein